MHNFIRKPDETIEPIQSDPYANIKVSFKPSMLDKSIANIILEKCNVTAEITESKLRQ